MTVSIDHDIDWAPSLPAITRLIRLACRGNADGWTTISEAHGAAVILDVDDQPSRERADATLPVPIFVEGAAVAILTLGRRDGTADGEVAHELAAAIGRELELSALSARLMRRLGGHGAVREQAPPPREERPSDSFRILLADDLDLNRKLIGDMLAIEGHVVHGVADGEAAVSAAAAEPWDLILMDMNMPGMGGLSATAVIRGLPAPACDIPIVALTAHSLQEQLDGCLAAGMNATLTKPLSFDTLLSTVREFAGTGAPRP